MYYIRHRNQSLSFFFASFYNSFHGAVFIKKPLWHCKLKNLTRNCRYSNRVKILSVPFSKRLPHTPSPRPFLVPASLIRLNCGCSLRLRERGGESGEKRRKTRGRGATLTRTTPTTTPHLRAQICLKAS